MLRFPAWLRLLGLTALTVYFLMAAVLLTVRYAVLPNIDHWRNDIEESLSASLQLDVRLTAVSATWAGWNPVIELEDVSLVDKHNEPVLFLPKARATLNWTALLFADLRFTSIDIQGLDVLVRQDSHKKLWVAGHAFDLQDTDSSTGLSFDEPVIQWLTQQPYLVFSNASIVWQDDSRHARPLALDKVDLQFHASATRLDMTLRGAASVGGASEGFFLQARFDQRNLSLPRNDPRAWDGLLYIAIDHLAPDGWRPWIDVPSHLVSGEVSAQWWLSWQAGEPDRFSFKADAKNVQWGLFDDNIASTRAGTLAAHGQWSSLDHLLQALALRQPPTDTVTDRGAAASAARDDAALDIHLVLRQSHLALQPVLAEPLHFDTIEVEGVLEYDKSEGWRLAIHEADISNADLDVQLQGRWWQSAGAVAGMADMRGVFRRAALPAIGRYMPESVNRDAREWLVNSLVAGELHNARLRLQGDLAEFPFGSNPDKGDFWVDGSYRDAIIDYAPATDRNAGWPRLTAMHGKASLHRVDLRILAKEATLRPGSAQSIALADTEAQIADIEHNAVLNVRAASSGDATAYLDLVHYTPLGSLLDGFLDEAQATGLWGVPLKLSVPLHDVDQTRVEGAVLFDGSEVALRPAWPRLEALAGKLSFSEEAVWSPGLSFSMLGGEGILAGGVGRGQTGMRLSGDIEAKGLVNYGGAGVFSHLKGRTRYLADVKMPASGQIDFVVRTDLKGMAADFPPPFQKPAESRLPLRVSWSSRNHGSETLAVGLDGVLDGVFSRAGVRSGGPYFDAVAVGIGTSRPKLTTGTHLDVRQPHINLNSWYDQLEAGAGRTDGVAYVPPLTSLRVQADTMTLFSHPLDQAVLTAKRQADSQWRIDISSTQSAGSIFLDNIQSRGKGKVKARFERLALGVEASTDSSQAAMGDLPDDLDVPAIDIVVDRLSLYGRQLGQLVLLGDSDQTDRAWLLRNLRLEGSGARLDGSGAWRLIGPDRGLSVDARVELSNAGEYLDQAGMVDVLSNGNGFLQGQFQWRNFPWAFARSDLDGRLRIELDKGRFTAMSSRAVRVLELLSWQSLSRLARFDILPPNPFEKGLPFDRLSGDLAVVQGIMSANNLHMAGLVANISLGGDVDLVNGMLDLQAMVVPNLDMSGASLAAGLAINPIVGVGAFLTQWALRGPLSRAMTVHYSVTGSWDDPQLHEESSGAFKHVGESLPADDKAGNETEPVDALDSFATGL